MQSFSIVVAVWDAYILIVRQLAINISIKRNINYTQNSQLVFKPKSYTRKIGLKF